MSHIQPQPRVPYSILLSSVLTLHFLRNSQAEELLKYLFLSRELPLVYQSINLD